VRLAQLVQAIKLVYASTFHAATRAISRPLRIGWTRRRCRHPPAVVGAPHGQYFYPSFAVWRARTTTTLRRHAPTTASRRGAGPGQTVVDGGQALRFCPAHPQVLPQLAEPEEFLNQSQRTFYAIDLADSDRPQVAHDEGLVELGLDEAERHGTLH